MQSYYEYRSEPLNEANTGGRYSVEVNFRTSLSEVNEAFAKICLGFVSAALKNASYHVKHVFEEKPVRILVSSRNWDDGEWVTCVSWNPKLNCFVLSKGFYNKDRKSVSIQTNTRLPGTDAAAIAKEVQNVMHQLKDKKDRHKEKMKAVPLKRGPK